MSAPSGKHEDSQWPADINDWRHWPEDIGFDDLASRIDGLKMETLRAVILSFEYYPVIDSIIGITPEETLRQLIHDPDEDVRSAIALCSSTPPELLEELACDTSEYVLNNVATNPNTPAASLTALADRDSDEIRNSIADNPNTPPDLLARLTTLVFEGDGQSKQITLGIIGRNPITPGDSLRLLATGSADLRAAVAANPAAPPDLLLTLSMDKAKSVRRALLTNPGAPKELTIAVLGTATSISTKDLSVAERVELIWNEDLDSGALSDYMDDKAMGGAHRSCNTRS